MTSSATSQPFAARVCLEAKPWSSKGASLVPCSLRRESAAFDRHRLLLPAVPCETLFFLFLLITVLKTWRFRRLEGGGGTQQVRLGMGEVSSLQCGGCRCVRTCGFPPECKSV